MKQIAQLDRIQAQMQPGVITRDGFLGTDERKLGDILEEDNAAVIRLGVTHQQLADRLRALRVAGACGLGLAVAVEPRFDVRVDSVRGKLPCPFLDGVLLPKVFVEVCDRDSGEEMTYSDLAIHMIEAHGFYQGRGSSFRLEPVRLVRFLDLAVR